MSESPPIVVPRGFRASAVKAGVKPSGGLDLAFLAADGPCAAAGTFTTNRVCAAPVRWCRENLPADDVRAIVVNAGNANAATGAQGEASVRQTAERAAALLGCEARQVLVASTGVIGHQLPMDRIEAGLVAAAPGLSADPESFRTAAQAILTTDTRTKIVSLQHGEGAGAYSLLGIAKGAAMIGPRMATMLAFLLTDAPVWPNDLQPILSEAVEESFNCVSVEGHTSTNDTVLLLASGAASNDILRGDDLKPFADMVRSACRTLAQEMADDGEGATHFITIDVEGAADRDEARNLARAVADSPLVKTAIHGADPNWGRIVSAAGYAGVPFEETELSLWINGVSVYALGTPTTFDASALSANIRANRDVHLRLLFSRGDASIRFWTCDLTAEYIRLNAEYTT
ncbi:MAG: bifunctional glutamate N-acetyltransferase/amino-acid acetyltransferase ArgJ [Paludisphaera borealis]|uniref:bifunctional glutamate N-acetyltransferase/amino-acid acetyltransferase ArgJ n=1 Tax=Paludisphaera borealis TaxID=1387353 RepID=UPI00283D169B|nr:bifunctional glutamate N-acetyltransferase/amino-acid acetyltransferase ArgJ [Paludisphaera borealis]MDR3623076.1 bifunctional glutamate N-acetyltransferase/amino-acid acetyltransferase ArgJ [Paludisphaera borealis]